MRWVPTRELQARRRQIAQDVGICESCLTNWMYQAEIEAGNKPGTTNTEAEELRTARRRIRLLEQGERRPAPGSGLPVPGEPAEKMMYPLVKELATDADPRRGVLAGARARPPALLPLAGEPSHANRSRPGHPGPTPCAPLTRTSLKFGYRLLCEEAENAGGPMAARAAWRLCQANGWHSAFGTKPGENGRRPGPPVHDDRVKGQFTAQGLHQLWLTDITEYPTGEGKLYLCAIKDLYAGRIVGYSMAGRMQASLAVDALHQAVARRAGTSVVAGCMVHSDRGWQFRSNVFQDALTRHGLLGSMGQVGSAGDHAALESFFALLQKNVLARRQWATWEE